ncbi:MAG: hypothetical protein HOQ07_13980 [Sinomonas sp.]|nr:hypothetical protein [Sinomonas sp.]
MTSAHGPLGEPREVPQQPVTRRQSRVPVRPGRSPRALRFRATPWGRVTTVSGAVVVLLVLWALVASLTAQHNGRTPTAEGVIPASGYAAGDCFADFNAAADANRAVPCGDPHSAQLVATLTYGTGDAYPGKDALDTRATELCRQTKLNLPKNASDLKQRTVVPTQEGWGGGDRRVDCFVESSNGNSLSSSLLP